MELTNREIAFLGWLIGFTLWALTLSGVRSSLLGVLRIALGPKLAIPLLIFLLYMGVVVAAANSVGIWQLSLLKDTVAWIAVAGLLLFGRFMKITEPRFVRGTLLAAIAIPEIVQYVLGTVSFSLIVEIVIVPVALLLGGMSALVAGRAEHRAARLVVDGAVALFGFALLAGTSLQIVVNWSSLDHAHLLRSFYLPIWLTVGVIPFVYVLGWYAHYESAFIRLNAFRPGGTPLGLRRKLAVVLGVWHRVGVLNELVWKRGREVREAQSFAEVRRIASDFRKSASVRRVAP